MTYLLFGALVALATFAIVWSGRRMRLARLAARGREEAMIAVARAAKAASAAVEEGETHFDTGLPPQLRGARGLEVAEENIDIEALFATMPAGAAARARAQLDQSTDIGASLNSNWPVSGLAAPTMQTLAPITALNSIGGSTTTAPTTLQLDVPLRDLALAWYEARGYRPAPAASALRPLEVVLRHRDDPARCYAFVYVGGRAVASRAIELRDLARSAGVARLLIAAEHGGDAALSANRVKGVRMLDWLSVEAELKKLDLDIAQRIVAIARRRAQPLERAPATVH